MQMAYISPAYQENRGLKNLETDFEEIFSENLQQYIDVPIAPFSGFLYPNMDIPHKVAISRNSKGNLTKYVIGPRQLNFFILLDAFFTQ